MASLTIGEVLPVPPRASRAPNHEARLVLGTDDPGGHSPFLMMAEDLFAPPAGFPTHPHRGIETVTIVLDGRMEHADHTGGRGSIDAGGVQFMTAGSGVMHSEMPGPRGVHSLQLWLNLPARLKRTPARYKDLPPDQVPVHQEPGVEARVYAGKVGEAEIAHGSTWPLTLIELRLEAGARFNVPLPAGHRCFIFVLDGACDLGANAQRLTADMLAFADLSAADDGVDELHFAAETASRALVFASPVIDEPVVFGGPFVMNTQAEINEAFADLRAGRLTA